MEICAALWHPMKSLALTIGEYLIRLMPQYLMISKSLLLKTVGPGIRLK
jgi:hypothetical protein